MLVALPEPSYPLIMACLDLKHRILLRSVNKLLKSKVDEGAADWIQSLSLDKDLTADKRATFGAVPIKLVIYHHVNVQRYREGEHTFLVGFCKYKQSSDSLVARRPIHMNEDTVRSGSQQLRRDKTRGNERVFGVHYVANLFCFGAKLCYHIVIAHSIDDAKRTVKQRDHQCKESEDSPQPLCQNGGMSTDMIERYGRKISDLLYVSSQRIAARDRSAGEIYSNRHASEDARHRRIQSYRVSSKR